MTRGIVRSSRYSPGNMDRESLEALFVGRQEIMQDITDRILTSITHPEKHYILLVGPRGSGKTHFVALADLRIREKLAEEGLNDKVDVALLNEEEWGVASYLDFLVRILRVLADKADYLNVRIPQIYDIFSNSPSEAEEYAETLLQEHVEGKTLLLICENLIDLFQGLGDEGQKRWRSFIQQSGFWSIVATTPALFAALRLQKHPFYGFFTIRNLERLDYETALTLLIKKAIHEKRQELAEFLSTPIGRARVRAIHHLAGGNHRAYVVLFDFLDKESLDDLINPFMRMVDDLTPYYQDRMRLLPPTQRKIIEFLCQASHPMKVKDISTPCLMSHQTAAKQIAELARAGFVNRLRSGRNTFCELSEPLMRICIEVKDNRTQHFRLFVEFLRHWFSKREIEHRFSVLEQSEHSKALDHVHLKEAVRCFDDDLDEPFIDALHEEASECLRSKNYAGLATIQKALVQNSGNADDYHWYMYALLEHKTSESVISIGEKAVEKHPEEDKLHCDLAEAYWAEDRLQEALSSISQAIALNLEEDSYLCFRADIFFKLNRFEDSIEDAEAGLELNATHWHGYAQIIEALTSLDRVKEAENRAQDLIEVAPKEPEALRIAAHFYYDNSNYDRALELLDTVLEIDPDDMAVHHNRGIVLFELEKFREASKQLQFVISHDPDSVSAHCRLTDTLFSLGDYDQVVKIADRLINLDPTHFHAYLVKGLALIELGLSDQAIATFEFLLDSESFYSLLSVTSAIRQLGDHSLARKYLDKAAQLKTESADLWEERAQLQIDEGDYQSAMSSIQTSQKLGFDPLLSQLLMVQARTGTESLVDGLSILNEVSDEKNFSFQEQDFVDAISNALSIAIKQNGPTDLNNSFDRLRKIFSKVVSTGVLGSILTNFLNENVNQLEGSLEDWERALQGLVESLGDLSDCQIPIQMLTAAVLYTKTGEVIHLLQLPLEQRQLLEDAMEHKVLH